jgi:hypothetical protein
MGFRASLSLRDNQISWRNAFSACLMMPPCAGKWATPGGCESKTDST